MLTKDFHEIVREHIAIDRAYREATIKESLHCIRAGEAAVGIAMLNDYIAGTGGSAGLDGMSDDDVWRSLVCDMPEETHAVVIGAIKRWLVEDRLARPDDVEQPSRRRGRRNKRHSGKIRRRPLTERFSALAVSGD